MEWKTWYWIILVVWALFGAADVWVDDARVRRAGNLVLIALLVTIGMIITSGPVK